MEAQLEYGNWVRRKNLLILGMCTLGTGALLCMPLGFLYHILITILFVILLVSFLFPLYAYWMFSQKSGKLQEKIYDLIIQEMGGAIQGRILDIGSGNGVLAVNRQLHCRLNK